MVDRYVEVYQTALVYQVGYHEAEWQKKSTGEILQLTKTLLQVVIVYVTMGEVKFGLSQKAKTKGLAKLDLTHCLRIKMHSSAFIIFSCSPFKT